MLGTPIPEQTLHSHVSETRKKIMQQTDLTLVRGSKIRMPASEP
jgi:hypothetical protein